MFACQYASPYHYRTPQGPIQASCRQYSVDEAYLQDLYYQHLIEEEQRHRAASLKHALIAAYEREQIKRTQELAYRKQLAYRKELAHRREMAYRKELAERRRRQYIENYENRILNHLIENLLVDDEEDEGNTEPYHWPEEFETGNSRKKARLSTRTPDFFHKRTYQESNPSQPEEQEQIWVLLHHLKTLDESEPEEGSSRADGQGQGGKDNTSEMQAVAMEIGESSNTKTSDNIDSDEETYSLEDIDKTFQALNVIGAKLDKIQEQHEAEILASPLTFDNESEEILAKTTSNKQFLTYEDDIMKVLLELDAISSHGLAEIRNKRKELVTKSENLLKVIDDYKQKEWERASSSSSGDKDEDEETEMQATQKHDLPVSEDSSLVTYSTTVTDEDKNEAITSEVQESNQTVSEDLNPVGKKEETTSNEAQESHETTFEGANSEAYPTSVTNGDDEQVSSDASRKSSQHEVSPTKEDLELPIAATDEQSITNDGNEQVQQMQIDTGTLHETNEKEKADETSTTSFRETESSTAKDTTAESTKVDERQDDDDFERINHSNFQVAPHENNGHEEEDFDIVDHNDALPSDKMEDVENEKSSSSIGGSSDSDSKPQRIEIAWAD